MRKIAVLRRNPLPPVFFVSVHFKEVKTLFLDAVLELFILKDLRVTKIGTVLLLFGREGFAKKKRLALEELPLVSRRSFEQMQYIRSAQILQAKNYRDVNTLIYLGLRRLIRITVRLRRFIALTLAGRILLVTA